MEYGCISKAEPIGLDVEGEGRGKKTFTLCSLVSDVGI